MVLTLRLLALLSLVLVAFATRRTTIKFDDHASYLWFEQKVKAQGSTPAPKVIASYVPKIRDMRYKVDKTGKEYTTCRLYTEFEVEKVDYLRCYRTSKDFDPVCTLKTAHVEGEGESGEKRVFGGCDQRSVHEPSTCQRDCKADRTAMQWPIHDKVTIVYKCCCFGELCNADYEEVLENFASAVNTYDVESQKTQEHQKHHHHHHHHHHNKIKAAPTSHNNSSVSTV